LPFGLITLLLASSAMAVNYGELDEGRHPMVGLMVAPDESGNPLWRCSGTLIAPTLYLTAGHCTEAPAVRATIWFEAASRIRHSPPSATACSGSIRSSSERVRMSATPKLIQINTPGFTGDYSILLSNNHSTGGTCFGDSGGPYLIGDSLVIGGVSSPLPG
jgi:hypothetical protein